MSITTPATTHRARLVLRSMGRRPEDPPPGGLTYCLAASTMQKRAAGMASSRAAPIGFPHTSQTP